MNGSRINGWAAPLTCKPQWGLNIAMTRRSSICLFQREITRCFYYFLMAVVVIAHKTKVTARRALTFIVRIFVNVPSPFQSGQVFMCVYLEVDA